MYAAKEDRIRARSVTVLWGVGAYSALASAAAAGTGTEAALEVEALEALLCPVSPSLRSNSAPRSYRAISTITRKVS
jgi:hypothetical protein